jgi:hypothetical protein
MELRWSPATATLPAAAQTWRKGKWRNRRISVEAAVTEDIALDILRADEQVRFSRGKHGDLIVGLIDRVGEKGAPAGS